MSEGSKSPNANKGERPAQHARTFSEEEINSLSFRVTCTIDEWKFGPDGLEQVPAGIMERWKTRCWASAVLPEMRPSKFLYEDNSGSQVWAVIDTKGNYVCTIVRYLRSYPSHMRMFEKHLELLLMGESVYLIKFAGAYATDTCVCLVLQPLAGESMLSVVEMKNCGPLPEAFLSLVLRSIVKALQALSSKGHVPDVLASSHLWLGSESVKMGTTFHFDWQPSDEAREIKMRDCTSSLPEIIYKLAGIPRERLRPDGTEELWVPGGFFPDAKYGLLAASMWPLRFGKEKNDRVRSFVEACTNPDNTLDHLLNHELIVAYNHLALDTVYVWIMVQGEYERFKYARSFSAQKIFAVNAVNEAARRRSVQGTLASNVSGSATPLDPKLSQSIKSNDVSGNATPIGSTTPTGAMKKMPTPPTMQAPTKSNGVCITPEPFGNVERLPHDAVKIATEQDKASDEQLIRHLYELFQEGQTKGSGHNIFKGLKGLESFNEADFGKVCREYHIIEKYRGAMTRTFGSPKQLRAKKEPVFNFKKKVPGVAVKVYEPQPMSESTKRVVKLSLDHWRANMKAMQGRARLRKYIQGTIWGRIGKMFTAQVFEEWQIIVMTKKLYDKREELRAIFGRDSVKRVFKCWVDYVFIEVDASPKNLTTADLQARPKTLKRKIMLSPGGNTEDRGNHGHMHASPRMAPGSSQTGHFSGTGTKQGITSWHDSHVFSSSISKLKLPEISSATPRAHEPSHSFSDDKHMPSPPAHKRVQGMDHSISTRGIRHSVSPQKTVEADKAIHRSDRLVLIEDRGIAVMEYRAEGFWVHQVGLIDVPKDLRDMWKTKGTLEKVRDGLRLLEMQHRDPSGVEVWSIADQQGRVVYSAVIYSRVKQFDMFHNHIRFLLAKWVPTPELEGAEPIGLIDAYVSAKHLYVVVEGFPHGNLSCMTRPECFGCVPEPMLSITARQMLRALAVIHSHGIACNGQLTAGSFWLSSQGCLKLGPLFHFNIPQKKNMQYSISNDLHCLLEVCVQIADARSVGSTMLARHEFEFNIQKYELNIKKLREERAVIVKRSSSAGEGGGRQDKKQQMLDETRLAVLNAELKTNVDLLEQVRSQIHKADEGMRLYPLTYSTTGRCHDFVAQAARPILNLGTVYNHVFISSYIDVGSQSLLRWVEVKGSNGQGNQLASTLYEADPQVTAEIERASQPKSKTPAHGSSMVEQQTADLRKIFQSYVVRGTGMDQEAYMDINSLTKLMTALFPTEGYTNAQIQDGFELIDLEGCGKIKFAQFCEWWIGMKTSDKLGLRNRWKKSLYESELRTDVEKDKKAQNCFSSHICHRWRDRVALVVYYKFKGRVIRTKHNRSVVFKVLEGWRNLFLGPDGGSPGYEGSAGLRIQAADKDAARRNWGRHESAEDSRAHGGALTVATMSGQFGTAHTPGGLIARSTLVTPNPGRNCEKLFRKLCYQCPHILTLGERTGNFAMRSPINVKNTDPQSQRTHTPAGSPRNQRTNLQGPRHEFSRTSDSKGGKTLSPNNTTSNILSKTKKTSPTSTILGGSFS